MKSFQPRLLFLPAYEDNEKRTRLWLFRHFRCGAVRTIGAQTLVED